MPAYFENYPIKRIGEQAFSAVENGSNNAFRSQGFSTLILPEGLEEIGEEAFFWQGELEEISFPTTLRKIGDRAFCLCGLKSLEYPVYLEECGFAAFGYNNIAYQ